MTFEEWIKEDVGYNTQRGTVAHFEFSDLPNLSMNVVTKWLEAAYNEGYEEGTTDANER